MSADFAHERIKSFRVPDLGEGLEEVTLTCWNVAVGDGVELNQTLCTVETAKAEVEIPSPYAGRIVERDGAEGDALKVGAVLARIDTAPLNEAALSASLNGGAAVPTMVDYGANSATDASRRSSRPLAAPSVRKLANDLSVDPASLQRSAGQTITRADVMATTHASGVGPEVRPVLGVQARMAEKMTLSHREIPAAKVKFQPQKSALKLIAPSFCGCAISSVCSCRYLATKSPRSC